MTPAEIIAKAQLDTHTSSANYDAATVGLDALNIVSDKINNQIVETVREDYFWDTFTEDTVIGQTEYNITEGDITWDGIVNTTVNLKKINKVFIKYATTDVYYTRVEYIGPDTLEKDLQEYANTQSTSDPFFYVQDRSIFLYPAPTINLTDGIQLNTIYTPPAIAFTSPETWLSIQPDKHYIYALGIEEHIYKSQGKLQEAANSRQLFNAELSKLMTYLKSRVNSPKSKTISSLTSYR